MTPGRPLDIAAALKLAERLTNVLRGCPASNQFLMAEIGRALLDFIPTREEAAAVIDRILESEPEWKGIPWLRLALARVRSLGLAGGRGAARPPCPECPAGPQETLEGRILGLERRPDTCPYSECVWGATVRFFAAERAADRAAAQALAADPRLSDRYRRAVEDRWNSWIVSHPGTRWRPTPGEVQRAAVSAYRSEGG